MLFALANVVVSARQTVARAGRLALRPAVTLSLFASALRPPNPW